MEALMNKQHMSICIHTGTNHCVQNQNNKEHSSLTVNKQK